ncbi:hypothetical protein [Hugenholtzia roseola]|uniref:hypothetical protein n=1 Tax=Hugenholtzia roseola TaxID=1002 RepID=UPI000418C487|nr:hypothetical protein [Hugenholtzia roseola]
MKKKSCFLSFLSVSLFLIFTLTPTFLWGQEKQSEPKEPKLDKVWLFKTGIAAQSRPFFPTAGELGLSLVLIKPRQKGGGMKLGVWHYTILETSLAYQRVEGEAILSPQIGVGRHLFGYLQVKINLLNHLKAGKSDWRLMPEIGISNGTLGATVGYQIAPLAAVFPTHEPITRFRLAATLRIPLNRSFWFYTEDYL